MRVCAWEYAFVVQTGRCRWLLDLLEIYCCRGAIIKPGALFFKLLARKFKNKKVSCFPYPEEFNRAAEVFYRIVLFYGV